ncbi:MAG: hypothetical protein Q9217_004125 [Psora testacea]
MERLYGSHDELGTLNLLTDNLVVQAAKDQMQIDVRQAFHKHIVHEAPRIVNDDVWTFNTQSSTQSWAEKGIVGHGVLLHYGSWCSANGVVYGPYAGQSITLEQLRGVAKAQGTEIRFGDIFFIRSGTTAFNELSQSQRVERAEVNPPTLSGVGQSEDILEWIWDNFSAVAADIPAFERWRAAVSQRDWYFHEVLLAGWEMPNGELFDLEKLRAHCKKIGRWSFFLSSEVCNVPGGVASPANALAIL